MTDRLGGGAWAADPLADSEDALKRLCETVAAGFPGLLVPKAGPTGTPRGQRPLGGPSKDASDAPGPEIIENFRAVLEAVTGVADMATQRVRDLDGQVRQRNRPDSVAETVVSVLIRVGKDVLRPFLDGRSD